MSGGRRHVDIGKDAQLVAVGHLVLVNHPLGRAAAEELKQRGRV